MLCCRGESLSSGATGCCFSRLGLVGIVVMIVMVHGGNHSLYDEVCNQDIRVQGVRAICEHRGWTYVGGVFSEMGSSKSYNFARYKCNSDVEGEEESNDCAWEALPSVGLGYVVDIDMVADLQTDDSTETAETFTAFVNAMACPEEQPYVILAGHFDFVERSQLSKSDQVLTKKDKAVTFDDLYMNVTGLVLFDVEKKSFVRIQGQVPHGLNETSWGVAPGFSAVLAMACENERRCDRIYVGGKFSEAFGVHVQNIFGFDIEYPNPKTITDMHASVTNVVFIGSDADKADRGVNGPVSAISVLSPSAIVFGGVFTSIGKDTFAASIAIWDGGSSCTCVPTLAYQIAASAGYKCAIPSLCCHGIGGGVYALEKLTNSSVMVGGDFEMSFNHPNSINLIQLVINSTVPKDVTNYIFHNETDASNYTTIQMSDPVRAIKCTKRDGFDRCVEVWVGGEFSEARISGDSTPNRIVAAPMHLVAFRATYIWPDELHLPIDYDIVGIPQLYGDGDDGGIYMNDSSVLQAIDVERYDNDNASAYLDIAVGGYEIIGARNVFRISRKWNASSGGSNHIKGRAARIPRNVSEDENGVAYYCPAGSFCPSGGVEVKCPDDWGIYCEAGTTSLDKYNICPEGYYCPNSAEKLSCKSGHFCRAGSIYMTPCFIFEVCPAGSAKPDGSIYGVFIVTILLFSLFALRKCYFLTRDKRRIKRTENDIVSLLGLSDLVPRWRRHTEANASPAFEYDDDDSSVASPIINESFDGTEAGEEIGEEEKEGDISEPAMSSKVAELRRGRGTLGPPIKLQRIESYSELLDEKLHTASVRFQNITVSLGGAENACVSTAGRVLSRLAGYCHATVASSSDISDPLLVDPPPSSTTRSQRRRQRRRPRVILDNVSGTFRPYRVTGILGPSGCGKTTLLSAIGNRLTSPANVSSGSVYLNGKKCTTRTKGLPLDILGFVPQDDIMLTDLTVRQVIWFSLLLKGNPDRTFDQNERFINNLLMALDLFKVRHTIVGDATRRGISGGQRKRVNIGIELVASPNVLLLDEPTSGLDSTASADLVSNLKSFAKKGLTVVAVIHQPRAEIVDMIDDLIVLREGGRVVYRGPRENALAFFENAVCPRPATTSVADFILDVTTQENSLPKIWRRHRSMVAKKRRAARCHADGIDDVVKIVPEGDVDTDEEDWWPDANDGISMGAIPRRSRPSALWQFIVFFRRGLIQHAWRRPWVLVMDGVTMVVAGGLLGAVFSSNHQQDLTMRYLLASLAIGLTGMQMSQRVFGAERLQFWREASAGVSISAYYWGKLLSFSPAIVMSPCFFLILFYNMTSPRYSFMIYLWTLVLCNFTVTQLGVLVSIIFQPRSALIVSVILNVVAVLFAGVNPNVQSMADTPGGTLGMDLSYARWTVEMQYLQELKHYPRAAYELGVVQNFLEYLGYGTFGFNEHFYWVKYVACIVNLAYIAGGAMVLSFVLLHAQARRNVV